MQIHHTAKSAQIFSANQASYWSNLSRFNNLVVIMNISMFFLTGLVDRGYYYTFYSLICSGIVGVGVLIPNKRITKIWYYWIFLSIEFFSIYYLAASIFYWVKNGSGL